MPDNAEYNERLSRLLTAAERFAPLDGDPKIMWLGAARNEYLMAEGVIWTAYPRAGQTIFENGTTPLDGAFVPGMYQNFMGNTPDTLGGGVAMQSDGLWYRKRC